jgi:hypothetical protein
VRLAVTVAYLLSVVLIYYYGRGLGYLHEVFMIPVWDFAAVFLLSLLIIGLARLRWWWERLQARFVAIKNRA